MLRRVRSLKNYQSEVDKLNHLISEADAERFRQQREYDVVINERDILGTQVKTASTLSLASLCSLSSFEGARNVSPASGLVCWFIHG